LWRVEDHTADVGLVVEAGSWPELLAEAARAFGEWTCAGSITRTEATRALEVRGADAVETWVRYWKSLHRLWVVEGLLCVSAEIEPGASATGVRARVACRAEGEIELARCADVKAVTWHGAEAGASEDGRWRGRIILDL
jgi:SHS2 domain-containing protein